MYFIIKNKLIELIFFKVGSDEPKLFLTYNSLKNVPHGFSVVLMRKIFPNPIKGQGTTRTCLHGDGTPFHVQIKAMIMGLPDVWFQWSPDEKYTIWMSQ